MSQNTYLSTDGSDFGDIGEDVQELMMKVNNLQSQNEFLNKQLREQEHHLGSKLEELKIQNNSLKRTNESLEQLVKSLRTPGTSSKHEDHNEDLNKKLTELESKLIIVEQNEQNLKRKNESQKREILDLKLKVDSFNLGGTSSSKKEEQKIDEDFYDLDNMDDEKKFLIKEVLKDYEDVKKENMELRENALNTIAEKEVANMELREKMDQMKDKYNSEVSKLMQQIQDLRSKCLDVVRTSQNEEVDEDKISLTSEEERELIENYGKLTEDYEKLKKEFEDKELAVEHDKAKFHNIVEKLENSNKELQMQVFKLTSEINNFEFEKAQLEKAVSQDTQSKSLLVNELEQFQQKIRNLEDMKEKNENKLKDHIKQLNEENHELDLVNNSLKEQKNSIEKELNELKVSFNRKIKEIQDKARMDLLNKEKEILQYKDRIENLDKERENYKNDSELYKKNSEKMKSDFNELRVRIKELKEERENLKKEWEEKWIGNEKKFESEKKALQTQVHDLKEKLTLAETAKKEIVHEPGNTVQVPQNTLEDVLDDESPNNEVIGLRNEVAILTRDISEYKLKLSSLQKSVAELDLLKKENEKLKNDINEITEMYESQIKELQQKALLVNAELQSSRKKSTRKSAIDAKQIQVVAELENNMTRLSAENKFLNEKLDIQAKEIAQMQTLNENNIKFLKQELTIAEQTAVNAKVALASLAYDKDCEIIKHKNAFKKLKAKVQAAMMGGTQKK